MCVLRYNQVFLTTLFIQFVHPLCFHPVLFFTATEHECRKPMGFFSNVVLWQYGYLWREFFLVAFHIFPLLYLSSIWLRHSLLCIFTWRRSIRKSFSRVSALCFGATEELPAHKWNNGDAYTGSKCTYLHAHVKIVNMYERSRMTSCWWGLVALVWHITFTTHVETMWTWPCMQISLFGCERKRGSQAKKYGVKNQGIYA